MAEAGAFGFAGFFSRGKVIRGLTGQRLTNQGAVDSQSGMDQWTEFCISAMASPP